MKLLTFRNRILRGSTAFAVGLAMSGSPQMAAFAQDATASVDCVADPGNPACLVTPEVPATEAPAVEAVPIEVEPAAQVEPIVQVEPAAEVEAEAAPVQELPVEEPVQPTADVDTDIQIESDPIAPEPTAEVDTPADTPIADTPPAETPALEEQAVEEAPVEDNSSGEANAEQQVEELPAQEEAAQDQPQDQTQDQPVEEQPVPEQQTQDVVNEEPTAQSDQVGEETPAPEQSAQDEPVAEPISEPDAAQDPQQTAETPQQPETTANEAALADEGAPTSVVADETTAEQSLQIQAQEERRREDARERRNELLGAAAVGAVIGAIIPALGGTIVEDQGDRLIVERNGEYFVRGDESSLLRDGDVDVRAQRLNNGWTQETVTRRNGAQVVTVRDQGGFIVYRSRIRPNGREIVLIDNRQVDDRVIIDFNAQLPPLQLTIPQDRYVVPARQANYDVIYQTFAAPPVQKVEQAYSLRQVRESERLRDLVRRVDLDTITFDTGQAIVRQSQVPLLEDLARASIALIEDDPSTVLLIEGHTDAIGSDISNLALSDRRAETVARILANFYGVPPESMVVQGYGESYLKVATQRAEIRNRRVTIRNITQLLSSR